MATYLARIMCKQNTLLFSTNPSSLQQKEMKGEEKESNLKFKWSADKVQTKADQLLKWDYSMLQINPGEKDIKCFVNKIFQGTMKKNNGMEAQTLDLCKQPKYHS